jgi:heme-degrading monooxygenase HmoA
MIIRIVKMEFEEERIPDFLNIFSGSRDRIRSFPGCEHLQLLQDEMDSCIFFTCSHWNRENDLETYRNSELFKTVWGDTKKLFRTAPLAWSLSDQTAIDPLQYQSSPRA